MPLPALLLVAQTPASRPRARPNLFGFPVAVSRIVVSIWLRPWSPRSDWFLELFLLPVPKVYAFPRGCFACRQTPHGTAPCCSAIHETDREIARRAQFSAQSGS